MATLWRGRGSSGALASPCGIPAHPISTGIGRTPNLLPLAQAPWHGHHLRFAQLQPRPAARRRARSDLLAPCLALLRRHALRPCPGNLRLHRGSAIAAVLPAEGRAAGAKAGERRTGRRIGPSLKLGLRSRFKSSHDARLRRPETHEGCCSCHWVAAHVCARDRRRSAQVRVVGAWWALEVARRFLATARRVS